jgi:para-nitrobenzyl esterase
MATARPAPSTLRLVAPALLAVACGSNRSSGSTGDTQGARGDRPGTSSADGSASATSDDGSTPAAGVQGQGTAAAGGDAGAPTDAATDGTSSAPAIVIPTGLVIATDHGTVQGNSAAGVRAFLGIPFGATTAGDNRWKPPQPAAPWSKTRDATAYGPSCAQIFQDNEDCLTLNVWSPDPAPKSPLPTMVWIYGGAFNLGAADGTYPGDQIVAATGNVVVVSVNYRVGPFGFLALSDLAAEDPNGETGNYGLMDQQAALKWVQANIGNFGGDKSNVTLFGESAGGNSVGLHLMSPGSAGLFHKAIVESGLVTLPARTLVEGEAVGRRFAQAAGCSTPGQVLSCLRAQSPSQLVSAAGSAPTSPGGAFFEDTTTNFFFQPIVDGRIVPEQRALALADGKLAHVPVLQGANADEGALFQGGDSVSDASSYMAALQRTFGSRASDVAAEYPLSNYATPDDALAQIVGDAFFVCPSRRMGQALSAAGIPNYAYEFSAVDANGQVSLWNSTPTHFVEVPYVFGTTPLASVPPSGKPLSQSMQRYWTRFATQGDPNGGADPVWPRYDTAGDQRISLAVGDIDVVSGWKKQQCNFWDNVPINAP